LPVTAIVGGAPCGGERPSTSPSWWRQSARRANSRTRSAARGGARHRIGSSRSSRGQRRQSRWSYRPASRLARRLRRRGAWCRGRPRQSSARPGGGLGRPHPRTNAGARRAQTPGAPGSARRPARARLRVNPKPWETTMPSSTMLTTTNRNPAELRESAANPRLHGLIDSFDDSWRAPRGRAGQWVQIIEGIVRAEIEERARAQRGAPARPVAHLGRFKPMPTSTELAHRDRPRQHRSGARARLSSSAARTSCWSPRRGSAQTMIAKNIAHRAAIGRPQRRCLSRASELLLDLASRTARAPSTPAASLCQLSRHVIDEIRLSRLRQHRRRPALSDRHPALRAAPGGPDHQSGLLRLEHRVPQRRLRRRPDRPAHPPLGDHLDRRRELPAPRGRRTEEETAAAK